MTGVQTIINPKICASCKATFPAGSTMYLRKTNEGIDYYCPTCIKKRTWYVYDKCGNIEASRLLNAEAEEMVAELNTFEDSDEYNCAEDIIEDGTAEEA